MFDIIDAWCNHEDYTAVVSLKIDNFAYNINIQWNNNMSLEERQKIKNSAFQLQHS